MITNIITNHARTRSNNYKQYAISANKMLCSICNCVHHKTARAGSNWSIDWLGFSGTLGYIVPSTI